MAEKGNAYWEDVYCETREKLLDALKAVDGALAEGRDSLASHECPYCGNTEISILEGVWGEHQTYCQYCGARGPTDTDESVARLYWTKKPEARLPQIKRKGNV